MADPRVNVEVAAPAGGGRLWIAGAGAGDEAVAATVDGLPIALLPRRPAGTDTTERGALWTAELGPPGRRRVRVETSSASGIVALWIVPRAEEIPPPPPREWQPADGGL